MRGTLISEGTGELLAGEEIGASIRVQHDDDTFMHAFKRTATTDAAGRFEIERVVPGHKYDLDVVTDRNAEGEPRGWRRVGEVEPAADGIIMVGEFELRRFSSAMTIEDSIEQAFRDQEGLSARLAQRRADVKLTDQYILLLVADPESAVTNQLFEARSDHAASNRDLRLAFANYLMIGVDAGRPEALADLGVAGVDREEARLVVLNDGGTPVAESGLQQLMADGRLDRTLLTEFLNRSEISFPDAADELESALAQATREDKRVLIQVSGPGCAPCLLLSRYLRDQHELIAKDYLYVKIDARMPHASDVIEKLRPSGERSIPWTVILSADGETLAMSDAEKGNIGFPSGKDGKSHFETMLRGTRRQLTDGNIDALMRALQR